MTIDDWEADLDLGAPPRYLKHLCSPIFTWDDQEEDLQCAALGWMLHWRRSGNTMFVDMNRVYFARPFRDGEAEVFKAMHDRILDWHWLEKGGAHLDEIHNVLIQRTHIRLKETPCNPLSTTSTRNPPFSSGCPARSAGSRA